jgi:predicted nucleic acid-binding protein
MIGLDTTVLVAHELSGAVNHERVRTAVANTAASGVTRFAIAPQVIHEFLHVATDPRGFEMPLTFEEASRRAAFWWNAAETMHFPSDDRTMDTFFAWMASHRLGRKRILDAALAATYHANGIRRLATANPDDFAVFRVFTFEEWAVS